MAMENNTDGKEMAEKLDEFADMIMTETRNECKELNDSNNSRYDTPAKRLRVDISEGTIYSTMTPQGADFSPSMKDDIIAVLDRLDELDASPREIICTKCGIREQKGEQPEADF